MGDGRAKRFLALSGTEAPREPTGRGSDQCIPGIAPMGRIRPAEAISVPAFRLVVTILEPAPRVGPVRVRDRLRDLLHQAVRRTPARRHPEILALLGFPVLTTPPEAVPAGPSLLHAPLLEFLLVQVVLLSSEETRHLPTVRITLGSVSPSGPTCSRE